VSPENALPDAKYLGALAAAVTHAARATDSGSLLRGILEVCARPGGALAAVALVPDGRRRRTWVQRPGAPHAAEEPAPVDLDCLPWRHSRSSEPRLVDARACDALFGLGLGGEAHGVAISLRGQQGPSASLFLCLAGRPGRLPREERTFARSLAQVVSLGLDRLRAQRRLGLVATRDDLTHAFNYRFLKSALRKELDRCERREQQLSVIMLDVDQLKQYNDRFGHLMGSGLLRDLARLLSRELRGVDWVAKYGGDEFLIILPSTAKTGATVLAERLRRVVHEHAFDRAAPGDVTASLGVASYPEDGGTPLALIEAADVALYRAKRAGRNRTRVAGQGGEAQSRSA
jgi:diguanylate cyclase (GGDEF)-like protein